MRWGKFQFSNFNLQIMKKQRIIELAVKMIVAALTAFLTAITTTSCMGRSPGRVRLQQNYIISVKYHNY